VAEAAVMLWATVALGPKGSGVGTFPFDFAAVLGYGFLRGNNGGARLAGVGRNGGSPVSPSCVRSAWFCWRCCSPPAACRRRKTRRVGSGRQQQFIEEILDRAEGRKGDAHDHCTGCSDGALAWC